MLIEENGIWTVVEWAYSSDNHAVGIESSDFTHDVMMTISGDFATKSQKIAYAREICNRLNSVPLSTRLQPIHLHDIDVLIKK
jgi:hypothetical protein